MYTSRGEIQMFADTTQRPDITPVVVDALALHITEYLTAYITEEMIPLPTNAYAGRAYGWLHKWWVHGLPVRQETPYQKSMR